MNETKLKKAKKELASLRRKACKARDLESLAKKLGREKVGSTGKEPLWLNQGLGVFPLAIPHHGGKDIPKGTKKSILNQLEGDIESWEIKLMEEEDDKNI